MIQMPRRSVTRFFIPLIDVLLLLFCIFLLMPIAREEELDSQRQSAAKLAEDVELLELHVKQLEEKLKQYADLQKDMKNLQQLKNELEMLRRESRKAVEKVRFHLLDLGPKGELSYLDAKDPEKKQQAIATEKSAHELIAKHKEAAKGRELYYYFLYPRPETGYPTVAQERQYKAWFAEALNSLRPESKEEP